MLKKFKKIFTPLDNRPPERFYLNKQCFGAKYYSPEGFKEIQSILKKSDIKIVNQSSSEAENRWFEIAAKDVNLLKLITEVKSFNDIFNKFITELKENPKEFGYRGSIESKCRFECKKLNLQMWISNKNYHFIDPDMDCFTDEQKNIFDEAYNNWVKLYHKPKEFFEF